MEYLDIEDVKNICYEFAKTNLTFNEPLPAFDTRYPNRLEAALDAPKASFDGEEMYKTLSQKAAVLFYEIARGQHPFINGNKRMACVTMFAFLSINKKWMRLTWKRLYDIAKIVAETDKNHRDGAMGLLSEFIENNLEDLQ